ncbi:MAG: hypothetical protein CMD22_00715 [Flavobacteriales bacterium]|nr:hypothetical protein [Flavobacteriales bacterium]|tara:strand:- start:5830 stop:8223 length:2394 start_codon:yes stop_codon:yes gene_type:complete
MTEFENLNENSSEETIDVKSLVRKFSGYWYYFILSICLCLFISFLYNRYTRPIYVVSTTIEIRDDNNTQLGVENILEGMEMFSVKTNLENEKAKLKSYTLAERTIQELGIQTSYFKHGTVQTVNQYKSNPYTIEFDSTHLQLAGVEFFINILDFNSFKLRVDCKDHNTYNIRTNRKNNSLQANLSYNSIHSFGEHIETDYFSFKVVKTPHFNKKNIDNENNYSFIYHSLEKISKKYVKYLNVSPLSKESSVLKLNISGFARKKNIDYLNTLSRLYLTQGLEEKNRMAKNTIRFIEGQIIKTQDSLDIIEDKLKDFKEDNPNLDVFDKEFGTYFQKQKTESNISQYQVHLSYYKELLSYLQNSQGSENIISPNSMGISNPELNALISTFITLNSKKKELELSTKESHPKYQAVFSQISFTRQSIIENLKNLISSTKSAERSLQNRVDVFNKEIENLPTSEKEYVKLKREFMQSERIVNYLILKQQETEIAKEGTEPDHRIVDTAGKNDSEIPISPSKKLSYLLALLLGFGFPVVVISLRDFFNETIRSKSDLTKITNIPILGVIGNSDKGNNLVVSENPKSVIAESFRSLRTNIQYLASDKKSKVITVTSSVGAEGKTFCSSNLALILATAGYKTILLGADLRKPKTHEDFNLDNLEGLSSFLINQSSLEVIVRETENENLKIITSGPVPPNPAELLNSGKMNNLIYELKKEFEYIIIDTPPSGLVTDSVITMKFSDVNLYVVRHNYTKRNMLNIINDLYDTKQVQNLNIIINDYMLSSSSYGYGYGYGYGNGYGYYE